MNKAPYALYSLLVIAVITTTGFAQTARREPSQQETTTNLSRADSPMRTSRVIGSGRASNHVVSSADPIRQSRPTLAASSAPVRDNGNSVMTGGPKASGEPAWGNAPFISDDLSAPPNRPIASLGSGVPSPSLTRAYRVGIGDVLDIRLVNTPTRESTLFTVLAGGVIEYPLIDEPVRVEGMSTEEIASRLISKIKVIDHPRVVVNVRDHSSHNVIVTGLVYNPGSKILRQEAVPLYVVLAEAVPRQGAARATITRNGGQSIAIDLADQSATSTLLMNGDLVKVSPAPPASPQYYYVYGEINSPGEKVFHSGLTLTQCLLASGGITQNAGSKVRLASQTTNGALASSEYNLKEILEGRRPDPILKPGDRLEIIRGRW